MNGMQRMPYTTLFFDVDETLYPTSAGVWEAILKRIEQFMHERLGIPWEEIPTIRRQMYLQYGTTLRGLQITHHVDEHEFVDYVHDVPIDLLLSPEPALLEMLQRFPQRKFIFTNADRKHASRVLNRLGIGDCFDGIIDILDVSPYCKPMPEAFNTALRLAQVNDPRQCIFIDDAPHNLAAARQLGFYTIRVGCDELTPDYHASVLHVKDLPGVLLPVLGNP